MAKTRVSEEISKKLKEEAVMITKNDSTSKTKKTPRTSTKKEVVSTPKSSTKAVSEAKPVKKSTVSKTKKTSDKTKKTPSKRSKKLTDVIDTSKVKQIVNPRKRKTTKKTPRKQLSERELKRVISNIKTSSSVKYSPSFTKSILKEPEVQDSTIIRYSDSELKDFETLIRRKLKLASDELNYLQDIIARKNGSDELESRSITVENGVVSMERERMSQMANRQLQFITHLEHALVRIENKTYGICRVSGQLIEKERLKAVPHATLSIQAKKNRSYLETPEAQATTMSDEQKEVPRGRGRRRKNTPPSSSSSD